MPHRRLLHEAMHPGADEILQRLSADLRPSLEHSVHQAVHEAVCHYAERMEILSRQLRPLERGRSPV